MGKYLYILLPFLAAIIFTVMIFQSQLGGSDNQNNKNQNVFATVTPKSQQIRITPTMSINNQPTSESAELKIEDIKIGEGQEVKSGDTIKVNYSGKLTNGSEFDSSYSRNTPFTTQIGVGQVIKGWDQGIIGMKVGGKRQLTIPSQLGYGQQEIPGKIPANSTLIFEIELLSIK